MGPWALWSTGLVARSRRCRLSWIGWRKVRKTSSREICAQSSHQSSQLTTGDVGIGTVRVTKEPVVGSAASTATRVSGTVSIGQWIGDLALSDVLKRNARLSFHDAKLTSWQEKREARNEQILCSCAAARHAINLHLQD